MSVFDVDSTLLIEEVAKDLQKELQQPAFVVYVKSGRHAERAPQRTDWWFIRAASIFYRIYKEGNLGAGSLRTYYGGRKNRGVRPHRFYRASGKVIRTCLQELEKAGYIKPAEDKKGRVVSPKGQSYLNKKAKEVAIGEKEILKRIEEEKERREIAKATAAKEEKEVKDELEKAEKKEEIKKKREKADKSREKAKEKKKEEKAAEKGE